jgi:hypothetical protein
MKQKLTVRMLAAMILIISFATGQASISCPDKKREPVSGSDLAAPSVHFTPLDMFKW